MGEVFADAMLRGGQRRIVAETLAETETANGLSIRILEGRRPLGGIELPHPNALGGGRFIVSPSERYAILSIYSGQSEEGYELFKLDGETIAHVGRQEYVSGEGADFAFASDEQSFAMVLPRNCLFDLREVLSEGEWTLRDGLRVLPFGDLTITDLESGQSRVYPIEVAIRPGYEPENRGEPVRELSLSFVSGEEIQFTVPWGARVSVRVTLPPRRIQLLV